MKKIELRLVPPTPYDGKHFLDDLGLTGYGGGGQPVLANQLRRWGLDLDKLRQLPAQHSTPGPFLIHRTSHPIDSEHRTVLTDTVWDIPCQWWSWLDLLELPNIGPRRLLALVNFLRAKGVELDWFSDFDQYSQNWSALEGQHREPAP